MNPGLNPPVVSVIVPIYNAERFLEGCLRSLKSQKLESFEVLMINDGSKDGSREICLRYAQQDERFRLIDQTNQGVSAARNTGLREARGAFCQFVDSDDDVAPDFLSLMVRTVSDGGADLAICDYWQECESIGDMDMRHFRLSTKRYERNQFLWEMTKCPGAHYYGVLWNKIYRMDLIRKEALTFSPEMSLGEDFVFNTQYLAMVENVACVEEQLYHYRWQQPDSLCTRRKSEDERITERVQMYRAYKLLFRRTGLYWKWKPLIQYYVVKAYFDELTYLGADQALYKEVLYQRFIRESGIGPIRYGVFWGLKQLKQLRRKG